MKGGLQCAFLCINGLVFLAAEQSVTFSLLVTVAAAALCECPVLPRGLFPVSCQIWSERTEEKVLIFIQNNKIIKVTFSFSFSVLLLLQQEKYLSSSLSSYTHPHPTQIHNLG